MPLLEILKTKRGNLVLWAMSWSKTILICLVLKWLLDSGMGWLDYDRPILSRPAGNGVKYSLVSMAIECSSQWRRRPSEKRDGNSYLRQSIELETGTPASGGRSSILIELVRWPERGMDQDWTPMCRDYGGTDCRQSRARLDGWTWRTVEYEVSPVLMRRRHATRVWILNAGLISVTIMAMHPADISARYAVDELVNHIDLRL